MIPYGGISDGQRAGRICPDAVGRLFLMLALWRLRKHVGDGQFVMLLVLLLWRYCCPRPWAFVNIYFMQYSLPGGRSLSVLGEPVHTRLGFAGVAALLLEPKASGAGLGGYAVVIGAYWPTLGGLTWRQSRMYSDIETLYRMMIAANPDCWMAYNNLGAALV